jgi:hypothetical protein
MVNMEELEFGVMVNSEELIDTTRNVMIQTRCRISRCSFGRVDLCLDFV